MYMVLVPKICAKRLGRDKAMCISGPHQEMPPLSLLARGPTSRSHVGCAQEKERGAETVDSRAAHWSTDQLLATEQRELSQKLGSVDQESIRLLVFVW
jgi:hypothetical protein